MLFSKKNCMTLLFSNTVYQQLLFWVLIVRFVFDLSDLSLPAVAVDQSYSSARC